MLIYSMKMPQSLKRKCLIFLFLFFRNHHCLVPLLRAGLVLKVNARLIGRIHDDCSRCLEFDGLGKSLLSQLSVIAESGFGEGEIVHHLMRATRPVQAFLVVSIPYIIRYVRTTIVPP